MRLLFLLLLATITFGCTTPPPAADTTSPAPASAQKKEPYRPAYHFTPPSGWMNDPNGLVYLDGEYHLFYQYFPDGMKWGPMHWGHAVSRDLTHWEHLPIALYPDELGYIFSGSAVVDKDNTAGFGADALVAIFTHHDMDAEKAGRKDYESQSIAYSTDKGRSWTKYDGNPVLPNQGVKDFRDPKVHWDGKQWVMVLAAQDRVQFYGSPNLKDWAFLSEWGQNAPNHDGVWECPDLIELPLPEQSRHDSRHVLLVSINPGAPEGGSGTMYFVGDWNGKEFIPDPIDEYEQRELTGWVDKGRDNYAGVTFSNAPNGETIFLGWMSNWDYAQDVPSKNFRSAMTVPRRLGLVDVPPFGYRLTQEPIIENRLGKVRDLHQQRLPGGLTEVDISDLGSTFSIELGADLLSSDAQEVSIALENEEGEFFRAGFSGRRDFYGYYADRDQAGKSDFSDKFTQEGVNTYHHETDPTQMRLHILVDKTSAEVFCGEGAPVFTNTFYPSSPFTRAVIEVSGEGNYDDPNPPHPGTLHLTKLVVRPIE